MTELDQLKQLVFEGGFDKESKQEVQELESKLQKLLVAERLAENPIILEYTNYLTDEVRRCNYLLVTDRTITEVERQTIFKYRDILERFTQLFNGAGKSDIEMKIKDLLNVAKN